MKPRPTATISNVTIAGNTWRANSGGGGGVYNLGTVTFQNSIVANSSSGGNCNGTSGYNLSSDNTCNFSGPGDLNNTDPRLGPCRTMAGRPRPWLSPLAARRLMLATRMVAQMTRATYSRQISAASRDLTRRIRAGATWARMKVRATS